MDSPRWTETVQWVDLPGATTNGSQPADLDCDVAVPRAPGSYIVGHPRRLWPREADFTGWLADNLELLAPHLGVRRLECTGREVVIGERWIAPGRNGREQIVGGMRLDVAARDDRGRLVIVEAQIGQADHQHLGQLVTYASAASAHLAVWVVADVEPVFSADHLAALVELNEALAGRREFHVVAVTVESAPGPLLTEAEVPLSPRLRRIDLRTHKVAVR